MFSEAVTGFTTGDVTLTGTAGGTLTGTVTGGPTTYNVAVTGMTGPGHRRRDDRRGRRRRCRGQPNAASTSTDNSVTWDNVAPVATIALQAASDTGASNSDNLTNAATLVFDVTFSESVTGLTAADFSNVGTSTGCGFGTITGSAAAWTVTATGCSAGHRDRPPADQCRH